jgi:hypothetical protein
MKAQVKVPECPSCKSLMRWHSERRLIEGGRQTRVQVFQCRDCDCFSSAEGYYGPAD